MIDCLLEVHIAEEETKFGLDEKEIHELLVTNSYELSELKNVRIVGLMGMASLTDDMKKVRKEFQYLKSLFNKLKTSDSRPTALSMGMTADYKIAIEEESNMIRIGSLIFGEREKIK